MKKRSFLHSQQGVAAIEFALILPLLLFMVFGVLEITRYVLAMQKMTNSASQLANVASNSTSYTLPSYYRALEQNALQSMMGGYTKTSKLGATIFYPNPNNPKVIKKEDKYGGGAGVDIGNFNLSNGETLVALTVTSTYSPLLPGLTVPTLGKVINIDADDEHKSTAYYRVRRTLLTCAEVSRLDASVKCIDLATPPPTPPVKDEGKEEETPTQTNDNTPKPPPVKYGSAG